MIGISDRDFALIRYENFLAEVLGPACTSHRLPLDAAVFQTAERSAIQAAREATFSPAELGWRWGPVWSTAWFRLTGELPADMRAAVEAAPETRSLALGFSSGTEALLWQDGVRARGFDENRDLFRLALPATARVEFLIEAACNMPLGVSTFWWDHPEVQKRWREDKPGRLERAELVVLDEARLAICRHYAHVVATAKALDESAPRTLELLALLRDITTAWEQDGACQTLGKPLRSAAAFVRGDALLSEAVKPSATATTTCHAAGHAHIDTAWLWPMAETRRKCQRSFANALELIDRHKGFRFSATQPQQYDWLRDDAPALFARITRAIEAGVWEASGAMWVEPDCNAPSAESLVRQLVQADLFRTAHLPAAERPTFLFLPDTFGFPACLPQLMSAAGIDTFITDKLAWSEAHEFPHTTFRWRGLDGTEVVTHLTPGTNYNAPLLPADLVRGQARLLEKDARPLGPARPLIARWLQPFGFGDGGGGPTEETFARIALANAEPALPTVEASTIDAFTRALHSDIEALETPDKRLPTWDGELYLEQHRGTYTSQSRLKSPVARLERQLARVEALWATRLLIAPATAADDADLRAGLQRTWRTLLCHQFHDILPGSSIEVVHQEARAALEDAQRDLRELELAAAGTHRNANGQKLNSPLLEALPAMPTAAKKSDHDLALIEADHDGALACIANETLAAEIHPSGRLDIFPASAPTPREPEDRLASFELELCSDRPRRWDAWNLDAEHTDTTRPVVPRRGAAPELHYLKGRHVAELRMKAGASPLVLRASLGPGDAYVRIEVDVDWQEERHLLRALVHTPVRAQRWTTGTQLGFIERACHANTSLDAARFETPGQRWMDVSEPGRGVAIMDDFQLGRSSRTAPGGATTLGLSLLRAPTFPDPTSDRGRHHIFLAVLPHTGDWRAACVPARAAAFADLAHASRPTKLPPGELGEALARGPFTLQSTPPGAVEVLAFKPAEDGDGLILRLAERHGGRARLQIDWAAPIAPPEPVDLHETPTGAPSPHPDALNLAPHELVSLRIRPA